MIDWIKDTLGVYGGTFVLCLLSGLILVVQAEVVVVWATLIADDVGAAILFGVLAGIAQVLIKIPFYFITRRITHGPRLAARMAKARERLAKWLHRPLLVTFVSASVGLPPYTAVSLIAGPLEIPFGAYLGVSLVGRILRYVVLALAPLLF